MIAEKIPSCQSYNPKKRSYIKKGFEALSSRKYTLAMKFFCQALDLDSMDLEAKIGVLIADIASDFPKKAEVFTELYHILISHSTRKEKLNVQKQMLDILRSFDENLNQISQIVEKEENLESERFNGIAYKDFHKMCEEKSFKEVFENLIFSTKIIFTARDDFYQFLKDLIANGFEHIALSYIEDMPQISYDQSILSIMQDAHNKQKTPLKPSKHKRNKQ